MPERRSDARGHADAPAPAAAHPACWLAQMRVTWNRGRPPNTRCGPTRPASPLTYIAPSEYAVGRRRPPRSCPPRRRTHIVAHAL